MSRSAKGVDQNLLTRCINEVERDNVLVNRDQLYKKVAELYNNLSTDPDGISFSMVLTRIKMWNIPIKTPPGKQGGRSSAGIEAIAKARREGKIGARKTGKEKFEKFFESFNEIRNDLKKNDKEIYLPLVDKVEKGSKSAAIKLKCLNCCGYQKLCITECTSTDCALYIFRPYQKDKAREVSCSSSV